jgi:transposase-like protein
MIDVFSTEQGAIRYLQDKGLIASDVCIICGSKASLRIDKKLFRCTKHNCRKQWSCMKFTFFAKTKMNINKILFLVYHWLAGVSRDSIVRIGGFSSATVTDFFGHIRELVADALDDEDIVVGGPGIVVEIDESKFGKRKQNRGHHVEGAWVLGGVERTEERKVFLRVVEKRDAHTLRSVILRHVLQGSIIITDFWRGYLGLEEHGYIHQRVNHSESFVNAENGACTNTIEGTWSGIKRAIPVRNRTMTCGNHLWEFIWRRRHSDDLWQGFLDALDKVSYD